MKRKLATKITRYFGNMTDDAKLWRNLLKVKVYYEDFNYEKIEESPSYSVWHLHLFTYTELVTVCTYVARMLLCREGSYLTSW